MLSKVLSKYQTDRGNVILVNLKIRWLDTTLLPTYPAFLARRIAGSSNCTNSVSPRRIEGFFTGGESFLIEYPFKPDTPEWYQFWQEILSNPLIVEVKGIGEKVKIYV